MKRLFLLLAVVIGIATSANAQTTIHASYGGYTQMDACNNHDHWSHVNTAWGALTAGIDFSITNRFRIGPSYTFSSCDTQGGPNASHIAYHAVLFNLQYDYMKKGMWTLYGHGGIGIVFSHLMPKFGDAYNKTYFAGQISPIGVKASLTPQFKLFSELGFGAQGVIQVGVSYDF